MGKKNEKIVQTAGRNQLSDIAPMFAHLNDDVLFGEVWNEEAISTKLKCILTVTALMSSGITDSSLQYHLQNAKNNGVSKREIAAIITHVTMYTGWPKGWAVFRLAMEIWGKDEPATSKEAFEKSASFPVGPENGTRRVFRGGSWRCISRECRNTSRNSDALNLGSDEVGLRLAL